MNSGIFVTDNGVSSTQTGLLTRELVLKTKAERPIDLDRSTYKRMIGGVFNNIKQIGHMFSRQQAAPDEDHVNKEHVPEEASGMCASGMSASGLRERKRSKLHRYKKK